MYFIKGKGRVTCEYHSEFRAYEFNFGERTFLRSQPGWACSFEYLKGVVVDLYNHFYMPSPGDTVVDLGAGLGEESIIYASLVGPTGSVHSVEANYTAYTSLTYLAEKNRARQLKPHHLAIYNEVAMVSIEDDEENYLTNTINSNSSKNSSKLVQGMTFDAFVENNHIQQIDFLKSNIEGAEQFLIEGMRNSIPLVKNVCISCHDFRHVFHKQGEFYMTKNKVIAFLKEHNFEVTVRNTGNRAIDDFVYGKSAVRS